MPSFRTASLGLVAALALAPASGRAQADPEAVSVVRELMQVTLIDQLQRQAVELTWKQMEALIRRSAPQVTPVQLDELKGEFTAIAAKDIANAMSGTLQTYTKFFTVAELKDMLAFYRTPTGRKTVEVMPALMSELMETMTPQMVESAARMQAAFTRVLMDKGIKIQPAPR